MWQLQPILAELVVEGHDDARGVGPFRGRVLAVAIHLEPEAQGPDSGATWMLVADDGKPAPVWVALEGVTTQRLGR